MTDYRPEPSDPVVPPPVAAEVRPVVNPARAARISQIKSLFERITSEIAKIYIGQDELVLTTLVALFSSGHVLIESVPGLGKTLFVRVLGRVLGCQCGRIQFTADLMPSDITGAPIFDMKQQEFRFRPGPVFTQFLLADEINRSPAKTHAALLEIMQEYRVTIERTSHKLKRPFLVLATQNPLESEGTYNLPEAQLDRFMFKVIANYPSVDEEIAILKQHGRQTDLDERLNETLQVVTSAEEIVAVTGECAGSRRGQAVCLYQRHRTTDPRMAAVLHRRVAAGGHRAGAGRPHHGGLSRPRLCRARRRRRHRIAGAAASGNSHGRGGSRRPER